MIRAVANRGDDLPPASTGTGQERWTARKKGLVCAAIRAGAISKAEAMDRYGMTEEEVEDWLYAYRKGGVGALKRNLHEVRDRAFVRPVAEPVEPIRESPAGRFLRYLKRGW